MGSSCSMAFDPPTLLPLQQRKFGPRTPTTTLVPLSAAANVLANPATAASTANDDADNSPQDDSVGMMVSRVTQGDPNHNPLGGASSAEAAAGDRGGVGTESQEDTITLASATGNPLELAEYFYRDHYEEEEDSNTAMTTSITLLSELQPRRARRHNSESTSDSAVHAVMRSLRATSGTSMISIPNNNTTTTTTAMSRGASSTLFGSPCASVFMCSAAAHAQSLPGHRARGI